MRHTIVTACVLMAAAQADGPVLYENARLIPGDGRAALDRAAVLADHGLITRVGEVGRIAVPASVRRIDLSGKTIMPPLIDTDNKRYQQPLEST